MGKLAFTPEQQNVIDARDCTLLVSAAAGSGKTAVLVQRVIEKLLDRNMPQEIDRLLVVTFTNAAAAQMKERIGARLLEMLGQEVFAGNAHLQRQMLLLRGAPIMTIHSFCLSLLREFFYELDLDPSFRIAEEAELVLLRADVMERLLERHYGSGAEEGEETGTEEEQKLFLRLTECIGSGKNDDALVDAIEKLYRFSQSAPFPESWLYKAAENFERIADTGELSEGDACIQMVQQMAKQTVSDCLALQRQAYDICCQPDGPETYQEAVEADGRWFARLLEAGSYDETAAILEEPYTALSRKKSTAAEEAKQRVKDLRAEYKKLIERLKKDFFFADRAQMGEDIAKMAPLMKLLLSLCSEFSGEFAREKAERGILDFGDLEHLAVRLLVRETEEGYAATETARLLRKRYDEIMMDECQDSNEIQDLILWSISREEEGAPNRFMVGDVKQSIYKFRMAKPELFMQKYEEYAVYGENAGMASGTGSYAKIVLSGNFRSRRAVVGYVNTVFASLMQKEFGGIEYDGDAMLYCYADYAPDREENKTELLLTRLEAPAMDSSAPEADGLEPAKAAKGKAAEIAEEEDDGADGQDKIKREAYLVAARIRRLLEDGFLVSDGEETDENGEKHKKLRPAAYRDVTVLLRTMSGTAESFLEVFSELGVPAVAETQTGFFKAQEVAVALNALRMIDNPRQDIPLVSVLRSEMVGLSGEELAMIRIKTRGEAKEKDAKKSFFEAMRQFAATKWNQQDTASEALAGKLRHFLNMRDGLCRLAACSGVAEVLRELYRVTRYPEFVRVKTGGEQRCDNLAMLVEKAKSFEKTSYSGIFDFVRYIDRLIKYETDSGEAGTDGGADAVRLMSIHKSKGLEAPIVVVAGLSRQFNMMDVRAELVLHAELGIGMKYRDEVLRVEAPTLYKSLIARKLLQDLLAEELRVLYVALTRAKEKLILSAAVDSEEKLLEKAKQLDCRGQKVSYSTLFSAKSLLGFLVPTLLHSMEQGVLLRVDERKLLQLTEEEVSNTQSAVETMAERYRLLAGRELGQSFHEELTRELDRRQGFVYPYPCLGKKRKLSVSDLKKAAYADEAQEELFPEKEPPKPVLEFLQAKEKKGVSGSERGTLYHRIMQCMDFTKEYQDAASVSEEISRLISCGRIRPDAGELVSAKKLFGFFSSKLGRRMQAAARNGVLVREQPFVIGLLYASVYKTEERAGDEYVMVQGIIDAYFEEEGKLVLVDYKTDRVAENGKEELTRRYRIQMDYYEKALVQSFGREVSERIIYAFWSGEEVCIERDGEVI